MSRSKKVLICTSHFHPNVGGVETHLTDLVGALVRRNWQVSVATYKPLAREVSAPLYEKRGRLEIYRMPWPGFNIVHKLTPYPILEFLYLFPGLFLINALVLVKNPDISVIHSQGLVPGVVGVLLGKIFQKRVIVSTHNLYFFPKESFYTTFSAWILSKANLVLALSDQSGEEMARIGIPKAKIKSFRYWLNLELFKPTSKEKARREAQLAKKYTIFFVGRLIETKGVKILMDVAKLPSMKSVHFIFAGLGPLQDDLLKLSQKQKNVLYVGPLEPEKVKIFMNAANIVAVPSTVDEGYGRVAMEAIACGTPVLAAKKGGLMEVVDNKVGILIPPKRREYAKWIGYLKNNPKRLNSMARNARKYALLNFSEKNVEEIIKSY